MEYILVTEANRMLALASLRHLADKNRLSQKLIELKPDPEMKEGVKFYASIYSSAGINSSLASCADQVYIRSNTGKWFATKESEYPDISEDLNSLELPGFVWESWKAETDKLFQALDPVSSF